MDIIFTQQWRTDTLFAAVMTQKLSKNVCRCSKLPKDLLFRFVKKRVINVSVFAHFDSILPIIDRCN